MKHILLVYANPPSLTFGFMPGPYGLEILRACLRDLPVECEIVNPFLSLDPKRRLADAVRPDTALIGISLRNLDDALVLWNGASDVEIQTRSCLEAMRHVISLCRHHAPGIPVVLGGAAFAHMSRALLDHLGADAGFSGMPERSFTELIERIAVHGEPLREALEGLEGVVLPGIGAHRTSKRETHRAFSRVPVVNREPVYFRFRREAAVRTFTGCPLGCSHCIEHLASRKVVRSEVSLVADEIEGVISRYSEVDRIFLADSEVNLVGERRTQELVREIRNRVSGRRFTLTGYFNPRPMSFTLLQTLSAAECDVRLTIDHISDSVLERNGKNFRQSHIRSLVEFHQALGLELSFCLLLGQPGETRETLDEVLRFVESIPKAIRGPIYFSPGVRVYPGTPLHQEILEGRLDPERLRMAPEWEGAFLQPVVYSEPWSPRALFKYVDARARGLMVPMNGYLADLSPPEAEALDAEFRAYHVGMANSEIDVSESFTALSQVRADAPFLSHRNRTEFLWTRGRLALQLDAPESAISDWRRAQAALQAQGAVGAGLEKLEHNITVAESMLDHGQCRQKAYESAFPET